VNQPTVLFLDEPTLGLDPAGQRQVLAIVRDIAHREGTTVVLSTHTLPEVEQTCSTVLILHRGSVRLAGTMTEVMRTAVTRRSGRLRVPGELVDQATLALSDIAGVVVDRTTERPDVLLLSTAGGMDGHRADTALNAAIRAVLDANVPILHYEATGARLADAFLDLTREDG
jgi:ABC-2 type transport system ATP-binding protein